jgi:hypothetical protein
VRRHSRTLLFQAFRAHWHSTFPLLKNVLTELLATSTRQNHEQLTQSLISQCRVDTWRVDGSKDACANQLATERMPCKPHTSQQSETESSWNESLASINMARDLAYARGTHSSCASLPACEDRPPECWWLGLQEQSERRSAVTFVRETRFVPGCTLKIQLFQCLSAPYGLCRTGSCVDLQYHQALDSTRHGPHRRLAFLTLPAA